MLERIRTIFSLPSQLPEQTVLDLSFLPYQNLSRVLGHLDLEQVVSIEDLLDDANQPGARAFVVLLGLHWSADEETGRFKGNTGHGEMHAGLKYLIGGDRLLLSQAGLDHKMQIAHNWLETRSKTLAPEQWEMIQAKIDKLHKVQHRQFPPPIPQE
jgi:hypothetical protein